MNHKKLIKKHTISMISVDDVYLFYLLLRTNSMPTPVTTKTEKKKSSRFNIQFSFSSFCHSKHYFKDAVQNEITISQIHTVKTRNKKMLDSYVPLPFTFQENRAVGLWDIILESEPWTVTFVLNSAPWTLIQVKQSHGQWHTILDSAPRTATHQLARAPWIAT